MPQTKQTDMFSKACEYGIRSMLYIAEQSQRGNRVNIKEISKAIDSPEAFTAKVLQQLARNGVVDSLKGPAGGFSIPEHKLHELKLSEIVEAIDGDHVFVGCGLGLPECSHEKPCPLHHKFGVIRDELKNMLVSTTVLELSKDINKGFTFLKR